jgi:hypothetical protein
LEKSRRFRVGGGSFDKTIQYAFGITHTLAGMRRLDGAHITEIIKSKL